jgi:hypothetical protein
MTGQPPPAFPGAALCVCLLAAVVSGTVSATSCDVTTYGAKGDNTTDDTLALQASGQVALGFGKAPDTHHSLLSLDMPPVAPTDLRDDGFAHRHVDVSGAVWTTHPCPPAPHTPLPRTHVISIVQKAISDPTCALVVLPAPGAYLSRPLDVGSCSNRVLVLQQGAQLVLWRDPDTYSPNKSLM